MEPPDRGVGDVEFSGIGSKQKQTETINNEVDTSGAPNNTFGAPAEYSTIVWINSYRYSLVQFGADPCNP